MTQETEQVLADALQLDADARALIAETLLESLDDESDAEVFDAWRTEILRRAAELDSGAVTAVDGDQVIRELRAKYGR
jgi:putative addiction module component (TIGR02574 family)